MVSGFYGNDTIKNTAGNVTIQTGEGNDTLYNFEGNYVYMVGGQGDDSIYNKSWYSTIDGGNGNDTITNFDAGNRTSINGGAGNDIISLSGSNFGGITINGGNGNDSIILSGGNSFVQYASGDGNDTITGISANDTLKITGSTYSTVKSGNDLKFNVGSGSILVKGGANVAFKINGTLKPDPNPIPTLPNGWKYGNTAKTNVTASVASAANIDINQSYGTSVVTVNGATATKAISITGNAKANSIKGGKGKKLTFTDSKNTTTTKTYSKTLDLMYDNNFVSEDFSLDSITEKKYSVTQIQNAKTETFAQEDSILAYSEEK